MSNSRTPTSDVNPVDLVDPEQARRVRKAVHSRSFAVLSTVSEAGFPHAAGVIYAPVGDELFVHTKRSSRKARNVASDGRVGVVVPVRRLPVGPPFTVQFQGRGEVLAMDDPAITRLVEDGRLKAITGHGELDMPDGCFLRIRPTGVVHSYGIGVPMLALRKDPIANGPRAVRLDAIS